MPRINNRITKSRIAHKLILYVVLFSSVVTLIITALQLYIDYKRELTIIQNSLDQIESVHVGALSASLWAVDTQNIRTLLEGIIQTPDMEYLEVTEDDYVWVSAGKLVSKNTIEKYYPLTHFTKGKTRKLGKLRVVATLDRVYQRLFDKVVTILVSNAIKTFLVAGFILFIFYNLVTRHLIKIAGYTESHNIDDPEQEKLQLDRVESENNKDEFGVLVDGINMMHDKIVSSYIKIKESEEKYRQLVEMAQEGIWVIDKNKRTTYVNQAMASMLGYSIDEMIGKHLFECLDDRGKEFATASLARRATGVSERFEMEFLRKDGKRIYATMAAAPVYDKNGQYSGSIAGVLDITLRKLAEDELLRNKQHLEELVSERTRALQLSNKELEAFSYSVAHDLRTPLRSITSFGQILREEAVTKLSEEGSDALERIIRAGKNMSDLIDELLELSRISRSEIEYIPINVSILAEEIVTNILAANPERDAKITVMPNMSALADPTLVHVLLQNLIQNAWKFSASKDKTVIEIGEKDISGTPSFYVKDNGVGFNMKYQHKLFEAFQRLHGAEFTGNGIGLATVHRIVQRHGGSIWAEAVEGIGATFYFTLPDLTESSPLADQSARQA